jgi:hypothetical protein
VWVGPYISVTGFSTVKCAAVTGAGHCSVSSASALVSLDDPDHSSEEAWSDIYWLSCTHKILSVMPKKWIPLESNPEVMTEFASRVGLDTQQYSFHDIYGLDDEVRTYNGSLHAWP